VTAAELYEIVKGVDRAAWPDQAWFDPDNASWANRKGFVTDGFAEAAFVGSMVMHKIKTEGRCTFGTNDAGYFYVVTDLRTVAGFPTLIEALAAVCKDSKEARP
jgi:hypothetical protein